MGILAFLGALLAVDVAAKDILGTWWWTPLVGVGLATLPCLRSILSKDTDLGPLSVTFYATYGGHPSTAAREQLLADLADAFENNAARVKTKRSSLRWALAIIAAGPIEASLMITLNRPTTNHKPWPAREISHVQCLFRPRRFRFQALPSCLTSLLAA